MRYIETIFKYFAIILMLIIIISVLLQIIAREIVYFPVSWTTELATFSFIWMSMIGAALGVRNLSHVSIDIIVNKLPLGIQKIITYIVELSIIFLMFVLGWQSIRFTIQAHGQLSPSLDVSMSYIYTSFILFSILSILFSIERIISTARGKVTYDDEINTLI